MGRISDVLWAFRAGSKLQAEMDILQKQLDTKHNELNVFKDIIRKELDIEHEHEVRQQWDTLSKVCERLTEELKDDSI